MPDSSGRRTRPCQCVLAFVLLVTAPAAAADPPPAPLSDEALLAAVSDAIGSIRSVELRYKMRKLFEPDGKVWDYLWRSGPEGRWLKLRSGSGADLRGTAFDGQSSYALFGHEPGEGVPADLDIVPASQRHRPVMIAAVGMWGGDTWQNPSLSVADAMAKYGFTRLEPEKVAGELCPAVEVTGIPVPKTGKPLKLRAAFSPSHDYLPRHTHASDAEPDNEHAAAAKFEWLVRDYFEAVDRSTGGRRWMPRVVELRQAVDAGCDLYTVRSAVVNPRLEPTAFRLSAPVGGRVTDVTDGSLRESIVGGRRVMNRTVARAGADAGTRVDAARGVPAEAAPAAKSSLPSADPAAGFHLLDWLPYAFCGLLAGGVFLLVRSRFHH